MRPGLGFQVIQRGKNLPTEGSSASPWILEGCGTGFVEGCEDDLNSC